LFQIYLPKAQSEIDRNYQGEIEILTSTDELSIFSTRINNSKYFLYVMDRNDNIYFRKQYELKPIEIIISDTYNKIIVCFYDRYDRGTNGESYSYKMHNLNNGVDEDFPPLFTKLKLAKGGKYLYASTHLFENPSPLDVYNIETNEHFEIILQDWIRVTSMSGNRLVILQQLSERNKKKMKFKLELREKTELYSQQKKINISGYRNGEISEIRFIEIVDSLNEDYKSFKLKAPKGSWTQLGTRMWIYDLDKKIFNHDSVIKDQSGNSIIMHRDDDNSYSLSVDENDNILIIGRRKNSKSHRSKENYLLKYDNNFKILEEKIR
jgi:hypothetical protein